MSTPHTCSDFVPTHQEIAKAFVADKDRFQLWSILTGGLAFTTYEEELEAKYGADALPSLFQAIYGEAKSRYEHPEND